MAAENTIMKSDLARAREIEFVSSFSSSVKKLLEALGITRMIPKTAGSVLKTYKVTGQLANDGTVAEGEVIPLSKYQTTWTPVGEITLKKWRKATTAEAIMDRGYDQAVTDTTDKMLKDVQKRVRSDFFTFLNGASGTAAGGTDLQSALADAWGKLQVLFEDDEIESVYFVHPSDVAAYLGTAQISTQTAFGMTYIENFLNLGTVILNSSITPKHVLATAKNNLVVYYVAVNGADLGEAFDFTSDETGLIGIHETPDYTNLTAEDTVVSGLKIFADYLDGVVNATITP